MVKFFYQIRKPWLFLPATWALELSHPALKLWGAIAQPRVKTWSPLHWRGLHFQNPLGISGGLDKNAEHVQAWWAFGAGFVEVGTVTPLPQTPNPGQIIQRDFGSKALWNKMGFPNSGVSAMKARLSQISKPHKTPIFVNIGKNRNTPNNEAVRDYLNCMHVLKEEADAFVVNISSPNTSGLRDLLLPENLIQLLKPLVKEASTTKTPVLLKLSPDMTDEQVTATLDLSAELGIDGWILTNTTLARAENSPFPKEGGVSGEPLAARSKALLQLCVRHLGPRRQNRLLISAGGVMTAHDVQERLMLGADLVQVYSTLVFSGPGFFHQVARDIKKQDK